MNKTNSKLFLLSALIAVAGFSTTSYIGWAEEAKEQNLIEPTGFKAAPPSADSKRGEALFQKNRCATCHTIGGKGGCLAPPLDGIGARRSTDFIKARITRDREAEEKFAEVFGQELMPHLRVPASQSAAIVKYLLTLPEPKGGFKIIGHSSAGSKTHKTQLGTEAMKKTSALDSSVKRGRALITSKGCLACHSIGNFGTKFAPTFNGISSRLPANAIKGQLKSAELLTLNNDTEYGARGTTMPPLNLSPQDMEDLTNYLMTVK